MTDLGADSDDLQSIVRFLFQSNEFDVECLIGRTALPYLCEAVTSKRRSWSVHAGVCRKLRKRPVTKPESGWKQSEAGENDN